jgi:hypothetical protein
MSRPANSRAIERELAQGGMGIVYLARESETSAHRAEEAAGSPIRPTRLRK